MGRAGEAAVAQHLPGGSPDPEGGAGGAARGMAGDGGWSEKQAASNSGEPRASGSGGPEFEAGLRHY